MCAGTRLGGIMTTSSRIGLATIGAMLLCGPAAAERITYQYDVFGQLKRAELNTGSTATYGYDAAGNRTRLGLGVNSAPSAGNDSISTALGVSKTFDPRPNDSDLDGDPLTIISNTNGAHGNVTINNGTTLTFTPASGYSGSDSFTYTISDGQGGTSVGTVSVTVATNQAPDAVNDSADATTNTFGKVALTIFALNNDTDPEGQSLTITSVSTPTSSASASVQSGTRIYVSNIGVGGTTFTYTISDNNGGTDTATVTIVRNAPDCPQPYNC
jgi:YD repeat-containing protein